MTTIRIVQLYPRDMNLYGDWGNTLALKKRLEWNGYTTEIIDYNTGDSFPDNPDIIVGGGGQDSGQKHIQGDLVKLAPTLRKMADDGVPMLMICGMYQLFGNRFITKDGEEILGAGIFDAETHGGEERLIGNIIVHSDEFGDIVGYENHSGQTTLLHDTIPLGNVRMGAGNTSAGNTEGARYKNVIGTYLHGSLLPRNPKIADFLITKALERRDLAYTSQSLIADNIANKVRMSAMRRSR